MNRDFVEEREHLVEYPARDPRYPRSLGAPCHADRPARVLRVPVSAGPGVRRWALPIGEGQTISQPYVVALMSSGIDIERLPARRHR